MLIMRSTEMCATSQSLQTPEANSRAKPRVGEEGTFLLAHGFPAETMQRWDDELAPPARDSVVAIGGGCDAHD